MNKCFCHFNGYEVKDAKARPVNNVSEMKNKANLVAGNVITTLGYHTPNDGGGASYLIREKTSTDTENHGSIHFINDTLVAELIIDNVITPEMFGAYGDGVNDDTVVIQRLIDYAIANKVNINFINKYKVTPTLREDNSYVALTIYKNSEDGSHVSDNEIEFYFKKGSCLFTTYKENENTLLRINISNISIVNAWLKGDIDKTNLIELSKINRTSTTESQWSCHNIFRNLKLQNGLRAIKMQGYTFYNTFDKVWINSCKNGILMEMTELEKSGAQNDPSVNRNDFMNITMTVISNSGLRIEYGDTNKFVNLNFEGVKNPIYLDNPFNHKGDYQIAPIYHTTDNMFINVTYEATTGTKLYNNAEGTKIINTSLRKCDCDFVVKPQMFIGGIDALNSEESILNLHKNLEGDNKAYPGLPNYSLLNANSGGFATPYLYDIEYKNGDVVPHKRTNIRPTASVCTNVASITYENSYGIVGKAMGGICFLEGKFSFKPTDATQSIKVPLTDCAWLTHDNQFGEWGTCQQMRVPIIVLVGDATLKVTFLRIEKNALTISAPEGGWNATSNQVYINTHWFKDKLTY